MAFLGDIEEDCIVFSETKMNRSCPFNATVPETRLRLVCSPHPRTWPPNLRPTTSSQYRTVPCCDPGPRNLWRGRLGVGTPRQRRYSRSLVLSARTPRTNRRDHDIRRHDTPASATSFVAASGRLLMRERYWTLNALNEDAFQAPYTIVQRCLVNMDTSVSPKSCP